MFNAAQRKIVTSLDNGSAFIRHFNENYRIQFLVSSTVGVGMPRFRITRKVDNIADDTSNLLSLVRFPDLAKGDYFDIKFGVGEHLPRFSRRFTDPSAYFYME